MPANFTVYVGTDSLLYFNGLKDVRSGQYLDDATITVQMQGAFQTDIGAPVTLDNKPGPMTVNGTVYPGGNYLGVLTADTLTVPGVYAALVAITEQGTSLTEKHDLKAVYRGQENANPQPTESLVIDVTVPPVVDYPVRLVRFVPLPVTWRFWDGLGRPVILTGKSCSLEAYSDTGVTQTGIFKHTTSDILSVTDNTLSWTTASGDVTATAVYRYLLWNTTDNEPLAQGIIEVAPSRIAVP